MSFLNEFGPIFFQVPAFILVPLAVVKTRLQLFPQNMVLLFLPIDQMDFLLQLYLDGLVFLLVLLVLIQEGLEGGDLVVFLFDNSLYL